ncbi:FxsA family protein [Marinomonas mediterranea]|uniref:FxsA cytoplasmic membrane protein n=1 Tax=Marinomonas mediterranea (strain ATCC 700492 / JCM 21426 / NBRC 103028 / MMB-1) TaxID=717774 RepID=F2K3H2_MARM1|nr:FxsA family protein [Marinomonas mediterranea]ADZ91314.1 FxsA cytoplasmic membrane protein [Marinomonas mediterranea MMB-1]WCN09285.1 FxsA family protein [Marinomonas mediterranea]WCN13367.1 FxsA family protein [Marinomonas mediterranea]WCN17435.1 FxsA family protein [Marinomonas mediterranea MMB-1]
MRYALLLFILVPVVELFVLIEVGGQIGGLTTVLLVFLTAAIGVSLIRKQGIDAAFKAQEKLQRGEIPAVEIAEGFMLAFAGLCLLIPGFVTDAIGALMLISPLRKVVASGIALNFLKNRMNMRSAWDHSPFDAQASKSETPIDGEYSKEENDFIEKK